MTTAIVVGASMAGLLAARALTGVVDQVQILDRDPLPDEPVAHPHAAQTRHLHLLLARGESLLTRWFPDLIAGLEAAGAARIHSDQVWWYQGGAYHARSDAGLDGLSLTRPRLDLTLRQQVRALPGVQLLDRVAARELILDAGRVRGVGTSDGELREADLVLDCSGRASRLVVQLEREGLAEPPTERVEAPIAYSTRVFHRDAAIFDGVSALLAPWAPDGKRGGVVAPIEGDRWVLMLGGINGEVPPTDPAGMLDYAASLDSPLLAHALRRLNPIGDAFSYRYPGSQWRHLERLHRPVPGLLVLGDALASFNPLYGQGMTVAAMQAEALSSAAARWGLPGTDRTQAAHWTQRVQRAISRTVRLPWQFSAGADLLYPDTVGHRSRLAGLGNAYLREVLLACHTSSTVRDHFVRVQQLVGSPAVLARPDIVAEVLRAAQRSPARTGRPGPAPTLF